MHNNTHLAISVMTNSSSDLGPQFLVLISVLPYPPESLTPQAVSTEWLTSLTSFAKITSPIRGLGTWGQGESAGTLVLTVKTQMLEWSIFGNLKPNLVLKVLN
jgi:hypothetical protein